MLIFSSFQKVFRHPIYLLLEFFVFVTVLYLLIWLPNWRLLTVIISSPHLNLWGKIIFSLGNFPSFLNILLAALISLNISFFVFLKNVSGTGFLGLVSGILGIGCSACGTLIISAFGLSGFISFLPLKGQEFNLAAIILLSASLYLISKKIP